ncbi:unnamed protein product, partial [Polarella glacialis]
HEWRRIHGALCLLERLLRPVAEAGAADCDEVLVGRSWFEAKMQGRLSVLEHFDYAEDPRVVKLVRRAATAARQTAERHVLCDEGDEEWGQRRSEAVAQRGIGELADHSAGESSVVDSASSDASAASSSSAPPANAPRTDVPAAVIGRVSADTRKALSALEALCDPSTREGTMAGDAASCQVLPGKVAATSPAEAHEGGWSRIFCCCRRRSLHVQVEATVAEVDSLLPGEP